MQKALLVQWPDSDAFHVIEPISGDYVYSSGYGFCEGIDYVTPHPLTGGFEATIDTDLYAKYNADGEAVLVEQSKGRKIGSLGGGLYIRHKMENPTDYYSDFEIYNEAGTVIHTIIRVDQSNLLPPDTNYGCPVIEDNNLENWAVVFQNKLCLLRPGTNGKVLVTYDLTSGTTVYAELTNNTTNPWAGDSFFGVVGANGTELTFYGVELNTTYGADDVCYVTLDQTLTPTIWTITTAPSGYSAQNFTGVVYSTVTNGNTMHNRSKAMFGPVDWSTYDLETVSLSCGIWDFTTKTMSNLTLAVVPLGVLPAKLAGWTGVSHSGKWEVVGDNVCLYLSYMSSYDSDSLHAAIGKVLVWSAVDGTFVHAKSAPPRPFQSVSDTYMNDVFVVNVTRHEITGVVTESGAPVETDLRMLGRNGEVLSVTTSSPITGEYRFACFSSSPKVIEAKNPLTGQWRATNATPALIV